MRINSILYRISDGYVSTVTYCKSMLWLSSIAKATQALLSDVDTPEHQGRATRETRPSHTMMNEQLLVIS